MEGITYGGELAATWQVMDDWRLYGAFTMLWMDLELESGSTGSDAEEDNDARGQAYLRSSHDLFESVALDVVGRYVGTLEASDVDRYFESDVRVAWRPLPGLELSVTGQNLHHQRHYEGGDTGLGEFRTGVERGVYFMVRWEF
jgi:iron complex outermembrane receptor protein